MLFDEIIKMNPELYWIVGSGFAIAFLLAFSVGANDVSNSFGTSVGSRVLTVTQACILATIFEVAGASLLGYSVCDTFRQEMYDVSKYEITKESQKELAIGLLACLIGSATWNMIATALKMPISGTHSIVGATIGFTIVLKGWESVKWMKILKIVASWFASPLLSGFISSIIYLLISKTVIRKIDPLKYGLKALPLFYGATIFINVASVVFKGPEVLGLNNLPWYASLFISLLFAGATICVVAVILVPKMRRNILDELITKSSSNGNNNNSDKKRPKPPQRSVTTSLSTNTDSVKKDKVPTSVAFDNVAFKPDKDCSSPSTTTTTTPTTTTQPEIALDPNQLAIESAVNEQPTSSKDSSTSGVTRPPINPKPAHLQLKRQQAQDQEQMEEIDLGPVTALAGGTGASKPKRLVVNAGAVDIESGGGAGKGKGGNGGGGGGGGPPNGRPGMIRGERLEVFRLFSSLQILTACFASFAHGTNDVSNAVAPLIPIWDIFVDGFEDITKQTEIWILLLGGIGICTGLWAWGRAVMSTVGDGLTQLTPSKGFSIELGAAISVLTATKFGLPISTTHCKVGSVVIVGLVSSKYCSQDNLLDMNEEEQALEANKKAVDWKLFGNIAITWIVTVPLAAAASAIITVILRWIAT